MIACRTLPVTALLVLHGLVFRAMAEDWPRFRGPTGYGFSAERDLPLSWDERSGKNVIWKAKIPGAAYSSPIVWRDRVFLTLAPPASAGSKDPMQLLLCFGANDGKERWRTEVPPGPEKVEPGYPAAAPTPATDGQRVYAWYGSGVLVAADFDGHLLWRKEFPGPYFLNPALASSPVLFKQNVVLLCDQGRQLGFIVAIDKDTGNIAWREPRPDQNVNNATPVLLDVGGQPQLIVNAANALQGLDPANGKPIWWCQGHVGFTASPAYGDGLVYADAGAEGGVLGLCVDPTGHGDVTQTHVKWKAEHVKAFYASPVMAGGYIYRTHRPGILECRRLSTGQVAYAQRIDGLSFLSSPIATADGRVYFVSGGKSLVLKAGPEFEVIGTGALDGADSGPSPAVSNGRIFVCSDSAMYCLGSK